MSFTGKIKCNKCGVSKGVRRDIYDERIKEFGSESNLIKGYLCRGCKKGHKSGSVITDIEQSNQTLEIVQPKEFEPRKSYEFIPHESKEKTIPEQMELVGNNCLYLNRWFDNESEYGEQGCNGCDVFEYCHFKRKKLIEKSKKKTKK